MIKVINVRKTFGDIRALSDITFDVSKGRVLGFLGANGAGKTTTMDIICGCLGVDSGTVLVDGIDITLEPLKAKQQIGYLPDDPPLHKDMEVIDFLRYAGVIRGLTGSNLKRRLDHVVERLSLGEVSKRYIGNLSKGFKQRVGLAQAMIHDPEVLVLDEPTEGLDPNQILEIRALIQSLRGDHTIILSSHILSEVENTCDDIVIIDRGEILVQGSYETLQDSFRSDPTYILKVGRDANALASLIKAEKLAKDAIARETLSSGVVDSGARATPASEHYEISIVFEKGQENVEGVLQRAIGGGFQVKELVKHRSSLEDVFLKLTKQHLVPNSEMNRESHS